MRHLASASIAVFLVAASGCCSGGAGACVAGSDASERCEPSDEQLTCLYDPPGQQQPPPLAPCHTGRFYDGENCPDLGFTTRCEGGYYVRPWSPC